MTRPEPTIHHPAVPGWVPARAILSCLLLFLGGCTHRQTVVPHAAAAGYHTANSALDGADAELLLRDGRTLRWWDVEFGPDSTRGSTTSGGHRTAVPTAQLAEVVMKSGRGGAWDGFRLGALAGLVVGALFQPYESCGNYSCTRGLQSVAAAIQGAMLGTVVGAIRGRRTIVDVHAPLDAGPRR